MEKKWGDTPSVTLKNILNFHFSWCQIILANPSRRNVKDASIQNNTFGEEGCLKFGLSICWNVLLLIYIIYLVVYQPWHTRQAWIQKIFPGGVQPWVRNKPITQIWKITNFFISSNIGDIKLCKFQGGSGPPPLDPRMRVLARARQLLGRRGYLVPRIETSLSRPLIKGLSRLMGWGQYHLSGPIPGPRSKI